ncbi:unnamed protein product [Musa acuminata subsp. malaccensis]|uniref:(wild Malaysian banana) hypothetical protein n=1 Tax=Musa acuminata subsp. malaccensis TaxID=214687 RepID=A0A8D7F768_MUSAM|nr:unnamed protein product [Musa acuminata subsp. malaccensis]
MNRNYSTISNLEPWFFSEFVLLMHIRLNRGSYQSNYFFSNIYYENNISQNKNKNNISQNQNEKILVKIKIKKILVKVKIKIDTCA